MIALILAAGKGTRLLPHTEIRPKPLFPVGGRPLLSVVIDKLIDAGVSRILINAHHLSEQIESFVGEQEFTVPVSVVKEEEILETGGAIKNLAHYLDKEPMLVVNSDILFDLDLAEVCAFHGNNGSHATLVLHDYPEFNKVSVDGEGKILSFDAEFTAPPESAGRKLAFTGIQVIAPSISGFFPDKDFFSSIEIYRNIIGGGETVRAFIAENPNWKDLGTPERYRDAAREAMVPHAFAAAFPGGVPVEPVPTKLAGDGSDRGWYRISGENASLIMADHGITAGPETAEVDSFMKIGAHLFSQGLPIPELFLGDRFSGLVFMEDLGDINLETVVKETGHDHGVLRIYERILEILIRLSQRGIQGFDPSWAFQTPDYDRELIIEKECRYFTDSFLGNYMGLFGKFERLEAEFSHLAGEALRYPVTGFMHRDLQSRNIMVKEGRYYLIDFQSGRRGPLQYDLASLVIDPYVNLTGPVKRALVERGAQRVREAFGMDREKFLHSYRYCALARNLQMLGAFAHLSKNMNKTWFEKSIPVALKNLKDSLAEFPPVEFSLLRQTVNKIEVS